MKSVVLTNAAAKQFDALPSRAQSAIERALDAYALSGVGDVKRLTGRDGFRMRIGEYRVIFSEDLTTILAIYIGKRATTTYAKN